MFLWLGFGTAGWYKSSYKLLSLSIRRHRIVPLPNFQHPRYFCQMKSRTDYAYISNLINHLLYSKIWSCSGMNFTHWTISGPGCSWGTHWMSQGKSHTWRSELPRRFMRKMEITVRKKKKKEEAKWCEQWSSYQRSRRRPAEHGGEQPVVVLVGIFHAVVGDAHRGLEQVDLLPSPGGRRRGGRDGETGDGESQDGEGWHHLACGFLHGCRLCWLHRLNIECGLLAIFYSVFDGLTDIISFKSFSCYTTLIKIIHGNWRFQEL